MTESEQRQAGLTRKELIGAGASAAAAALLAQGGGVEQALAAARGKRRNVAGMNIILFLTDQERAIQHFPQNWLRQNLPGMRRLRRHGLSFERAFTNACMCSPARSTLMSGYFPAQHGVKYTLEEDMEPPEEPAGRAADRPRQPGHGDEGGRLQRRLQGQVALLEAGRTRTRGPGRPRKVRLRPLEPARRRRQPDRPRGRRRLRRQRRPLHRLGRRRRETRGRCSTSSSDAGAATALLHGDLAGQPPRRPLLPEQNFEEAGYDRTWLEGDIERAGDQRRRPLDQADRPGTSSCKIFNLTGKPKNGGRKAQLPELLRQPDALLRQLPGQRPRQARRDRPARRHADRPHRRPRRDGPRPRRPAAEELQLLRGGDPGAARLLEPEALPAAADRTDALVSHVDFLPTLASLAAAPRAARANWQGVDYSKLVLHPAANDSAQDYIVFTYDDYQSGQANRPLPETAEPHRQHPRRALEAGQVLRRQPEDDQRKPPQWEMYDLENDPLEKRQHRPQGPNAPNSRSANSGG